MEDSFERHVVMDGGMIEGVMRGLNDMSANT